MNIDKRLINSFARSTERAAYGASLFKGKNDKNAANDDGRAVRPSAYWINSMLTSE